MLWRYEYISFKSTITDSQDDNSRTENDKADKMLFEKATSKSTAKKDDGSSFKSRKSTGSSKKNSQLNIVESNGSIFFSKAILKYMVDQQFEYQHGGSTQIGE